MDNFVYEVKKDIKLENFIELGYARMPEEICGEERIVFKSFSVDKSSDLVKLLMQIYNDPKWQEEMKNQGIWDDYISSGIVFESYYNEDTNETNYYVVENEALYELISNWRLEISFDDSDIWVGMASFDFSYPYVYYNTNIINKYCPDLVQELFNQNLIEEKRVENEG